MKILFLDRFPEYKGVTIGTLSVEQKPPFCWTLERSWFNNESFKSCIPIGEYNCDKIESEKLKKDPANYKKFNFKTFSPEVKNRTGILFHIGNKLSETQGCILLGQKVVCGSDGVPELLWSASAFADFMEILKHDIQFKLVVKNITRN